jgi:hypothetical protein
MAITLAPQVFCLPPPARLRAAPIVFDGRRIGGGWLSGGGRGGRPLLKFHRSRTTKGLGCLGPRLHPLAPQPRTEALNPATPSQPRRGSH